MLLLSVAPNAHLLLRQGAKKRFPWFNWVFFSVKLVKSDTSLQPLLETAKEMADDTANPCILVESEKLPETLVSSPSLFSLFKGKTSKFIYVNVDTSGKHVNILFKESPF
jgi:hypothetical protein